MKQSQILKTYKRILLQHKTNRRTTEERAIEYLIMKDIPQKVENWDKGNKPRLVTCRKEQLPSTRVWRNAWKINEELTIQKDEVA